jgi:hypothetical protein
MQTMKITRRTALLGVAGGMIGGLPIAAATQPSPVLWSTWRKHDHALNTRTSILVLRDGQGGFVTHYPDGRIEKFDAPFPEWK